MATISTKFTADTTGLQSGVSRVTKSLNGLKSAANGIGNAIKASIGPLLVMGGAVAGAVGVGAKAILDYGGALQDLSDVTGIAVKDLVVLGDVFERAGMNMESIQPTLIKMTKSLANPSDALVTTLGKLGINLKYLKGLSMVEQFKLIGNAIGGLENQSDKINASLAIFGKSGASLIRIFKDSNVFTDADERLGAFSDRMETLAPFLESLGDAVAQIKVKFLDFFSVLLTDHTGELQKLTDFIEGMNLAPIAEKIKANIEEAGFVGGLAKSIADAIRDDEVKKAIEEVIKATFSIGKGLVVGAYNALSDTGQAVVVTASAVFVTTELIKWAKVIGKVTGLTGAVTAWLQNMMGAYKFLGGVASLKLLAAGLAGQVGGTIVGDAIGREGRDNIKATPYFPSDEALTRNLETRILALQAEDDAMLKRIGLLNKEELALSKVNYEMNKAKPTSRLEWDILKSQAMPKIPDFLKRPSEFTSNIPSWLKRKEEPKREMSIDSYKPFLSSLARIGGASAFTKNPMTDLQKITNNFLAKIEKNTANLTATAVWS